MKKNNWKWIIGAIASLALFAFIKFYFFYPTIPERLIYLDPTLSDIADINFDGQIIPREELPSDEEVVNHLILKCLKHEGFHNYARFYDKYTVQYSPFLFKEDKYFLIRAGAGIDPGTITHLTEYSWTHRGEGYGHFKTIISDNLYGGCDGVRGIQDSN